MITIGTCHERSGILMFHFNYWSITCFIHPAIIFSQTLSRRPEKYSIIFILYGQNIDVTKNPHNVLRMEVLIPITPSKYTSKLVCQYKAIIFSICLRVLCKKTSKTYLSRQSELFFKYNQSPPTFHSIESFSQQGSIREERCICCYVNNYYLFIEIANLFNRMMHFAIGACKIIRSGFSRFHGRLKYFAYEQTI